MLEIIEISRRFGDVVALAGVTFRVAPGEVVGFVGRNGAGKTTAMRVVLGLVEPDEGEVRWHERTVSRDIRRRMGYLPEERGLFPRMSVAEQLTFFGRLSGLAHGTARAAGRSGSSASGCPNDRAILSGSCRSAINSACSWRRRWSPIPRSSYWTSRSPASTPSG